jgi:hypothetical protein
MIFDQNRRLVACEDSTHSLHGQLVGALDIEFHEVDMLICEVPLQRNRVDGGRHLGVGGKSILEGRGANPEGRGSVG